MGSWRSSSGNRCRRCASDDAGRHPAFLRRQRRPLPGSGRHHLCRHPGRWPSRNLAGPKLSVRFVAAQPLLPRGGWCTSGDVPHRRGRHNRSEGDFLRQREIGACSRRRRRRRPRLCRHGRPRMACNRDYHRWLADCSRAAGTAVPQEPEYQAPAGADAWRVAQPAAWHVQFPGRCRLPAGRRVFASGAARKGAVPAGRPRRRAG